MANSDEAATSLSLTHHKVKDLWKETMELYSQKSTNKFQSEYHLFLEKKLLQILQDKFKITIFKRNISLITH